MKVIPLGTNGFFPSFNRQTACYAIPYGEILIILDAGSGLFRLAEERGLRLLRNVKEIHLYLSHYHLDHTFGFYAAFKLFAGIKTAVYGSHSRQVFSEFVKLKHFPVDFAKMHKNFEWKTVNEGLNKTGDIKVSVRRQSHRGEGSLAYKFQFPAGKSIAYVTDSEPSHESVDFVKDVDLLLHEHEKSGKNSVYKKGATLEKLYEDGHVTTEGAALTAKEGKVKKLYLIHHNPFLNNNDLRGELSKAKGIFGESFLAEDLEEVEF